MIIISPPPNRTPFLRPINVGVRAAEALDLSRLRFYGFDVKSKIVQLAGSPAIPVPQPLLDACNLTNEVEVEAQGGCLIIRNPIPPRAGWEEAFRRMAADGDDRLMLNDTAANDWDQKEWEW